MLAPVDPHGRRHRLAAGAEVARRRPEPVAVREHLRADRAGVGRDRHFGRFARRVARLGEPGFDALHSDDRRVDAAVRRIRPVDLRPAAAQVADGESEDVGARRRRGRGDQRSVCGPAPSAQERDHTALVAARPSRTLSVRTASIRTRAARVRMNRTTAASRNPSPFGETVVRRRRSPANRAEPFDTASAWSAGGEGGSARAKIMRVPAPPAAQPASGSAAATRPPGCSCPGRAPTAPRPRRRSRRSPASRPPPRAARRRRGRSERRP